MTKRELKNTIKNELKEEAKNLRQLKLDRKYLEDGTFVRVLWKTQGMISSAKWNYRNKHIAYCMFFNNTPYEEIERTCNDDPYWRTIDKYKSDWKEGIEDETENVCVSA